MNKGKPSATAECLVDDHVVGDDLSCEFEDILELSKKDEIAVPEESTQRDVRKSSVARCHPTEHRVVFLVRCLIHRIHKGDTGEIIGPNHDSRITRVR